MKPEIPKGAKDELSGMSMDTGLIVLIVVCSLLVVVLLGYLLFFHNR